MPLPESPLASIVIRTKDEERWITPCLNAVFNQSYTNFEAIIVDNNSTDKTIEKARSFAVRVLSIDEFLPGRAINEGIRSARGEVIVCLSAHCIPVNEHWLAGLIAPLRDDTIAGVYGRQEPMSFSSDFDKRDLAIVFGLDRKIQKKDPFFHNANSAFRREVWERIPFDETVTNIEDRVWGKEVISRGFHIAYEPDASVYHYHGIHQGGDAERCKNVVRVLEHLAETDTISNRRSIDPAKLNISALIPVKGPVQYVGDTPLIHYTIKAAQEASLINQTIVVPDNPETAAESKKLGAAVPFIRPPDLSAGHVTIDEVLQYSLSRLEEQKVFPDIILIMSVSYPLREKGLIDGLIREHARCGMDTLIPVRAEYRAVWKKVNETVTILDEGRIPRLFKQHPIYISLFGLGTVTYPSFIRNGNPLGENVGIYEIKNTYSCIEYRSGDKSGIDSHVVRMCWEHR